MMRALAAGLLVLAVAAGLAPAPAVAAGDAVLVEAFFAACLTGFRNPAERAKAVDAAGFRPIADDAHPTLAVLMTAARRELAEAAKEKFGTAFAVYGRGSGDDALYLVTNEVDQPPENTDFRIDLMGCRLYDFAAAGPVDPTLLTRKLVQQPAQAMDEPGGFVVRKWASGVREGIWDVTSLFVVKGGSYQEKTGFSGAMLQVTSTKESKEDRAK